jgi:hypothetical protein
MRELRIQVAARPYRVLYAFDPRRTAILLLGGDKTGDERWYEVNSVPAARFLGPLSLGRPNSGIAREGTTTGGDTRQQAAWIRHPGRRGWP